MNIILPKLVATGIYDSRIAVKSKKITKNRTTTMFEVELPIEKGGTSYIDSERASIFKGNVVCAKPGQIRHTRLPYKCYYVHMILKEGALYDTLTDIPVFFETAKYETYKSIFQKLFKYYNSGVTQDEIIIQSLLLELIHLLAHDSSSLKKYAFDGKNNSEIIDKVIRYIEENLQSDLSLEKIAAFASFSPVYFHNYFKRATGDTLHQYIEKLRIKKASNLLVTTDWTLSRISQECGFSSQSYFSYAFKRHVKLTPREYAKKTFDMYEL